MSYARHKQISLSSMNWKLFSRLIPGILLSFTTSCEMSTSTTAALYPVKPPRDSRAYFMSSAFRTSCFSFTHLLMWAFIEAISGVTEVVADDVYATTRTDLRQAQKKCSILVTLLLLSGRSKHCLMVRYSSFRVFRKCSMMDVTAKLFWGAYIKKVTKTFNLVFVCSRLSNNSPNVPTSTTLTEMFTEMIHFIAQSITTKQLSPLSWSSASCFSCLFLVDRA